MSEKLPAISRLDFKDIDLSFISQQPVIKIEEFTVDRQWLQEKLKWGPLIISVGDVFSLRIIKPGGKKQFSRAIIHSIRNGRITVRLSQMEGRNEREVQHG